MAVSITIDEPLQAFVAAGVVAVGCLVIRDKLSIVGRARFIEKSKITENHGAIDTRIIINSGGTADASIRRWEEFQPIKVPVG